jgi:pimeloyl-ACP methyl ester carboxylesterase
LELVTLKSKHQIAVHYLAEGAGERTIVLCHAAPGAGNFDPNPVETAKRQVNFISVDRPGYGASPPPKRGEWVTVSACADEVAEILKRTVKAPVGVAGWSAGGRVALALAARHPELVERVAVIATPAPDEYVPWIPPPQREGLEAMRGQSAATVHKQLGEQLSQMLPPEPKAKDLLGLLGDSPADADALAMPGAKKRVVAMLEAAFAQGMTGLAADIAGYCLQPWGFEPGQVKTKTLLLYGAKDPVAGNKHGTWWQKNLPDARLEMVPGTGHMLIIPMWARVLSFLAPGLKSR